MKNFLKTAWKKIKCAVKEVLNLITNLFTPVMSGLCVLAELLQLPTSVISALKRAEYWLWKACGTKDAINDFIDTVDKAVDKADEESELK